MALWEDAETRDFYEGLTDLRVFLPPVLFGVKVRNSNVTFLNVFSLMQTCGNESHIFASLAEINPDLL
jgi:hypothetical protein